MSKSRRHAMDVDRDLLTMTQAAKVLKIRPSTIKRWVAQGLPTMRIGPRKLRISRSLLLASLTRPPQPTRTTSSRLPPSWRLIVGGRDQSPPCP